MGVGLRRTAMADTERESSMGERNNPLTDILGNALPTNPERDVSDVDSEQGYVVEDDNPFLNAYEVQKMALVN